MSQEKDVQALLREGIEAARSGDKVTARARFEAALELDENNEKAWYWLTSVVETDEERRVCLNNVLFINPNNERARAMLDKLEARYQKQEGDAEVIPGVSRRLVTIIAGGGMALILLLIGILLVVVTSRNNQIAAQTATAQAIVAAQTQAQILVETQAAEATETRIAEVGTATPTLRAIVNTLPPTFTPTPTPVVEEIIDTRLEPPPADLPGVLVGWGGLDALSNNALDLFVFPFNAQRRQIGNERGREIRFAGSASRVAYTRYFQVTFEFGVEVVNINGTQPRVVLSTNQFFRPQQPDYCSTVDRMVFKAIDLNQINVDNAVISSLDDAPPTQLYIRDDSSDSVIQITNDAAEYSYPAFSPDCTQVAAIRNNVNSPTPGNDIVIIDVANRTQRPLTNDLDNFSEMAPRWSPDGGSILYAAAPATDPNNHDLILRRSDGGGTPELLARSPGDDIFPVLSPDARYLAFASNRGGSYDIYILNMMDRQTLWQLTADRNPFFPGDWR